MHRSLIPGEVLLMLKKNTTSFRIYFCLTRWWKLPKITHVVRYTRDLCVLRRCSVCRKNVIRWRDLSTFFTIAVIFIQIFFSFGLWPLIHLCLIYRNKPQVNDFRPLVETFDKDIDGKSSENIKTWRKKLRFLITLFLPRNGKTSVIVLQ